MKSVYGSLLGCAILIACSQANTGGTDDSSQALKDTPSVCPADGCDCADLPDLLTTLALFPEGRVDLAPGPPNTKAPPAPAGKSFCDTAMGSCKITPPAAGPANRCGKRLRKIGGVLQPILGLPASMPVDLQCVPRSHDIKRPAGCPSSGSSKQDPTAVSIPLCGDDGEPNRCVVRVECQSLPTGTDHGSTCRWVALLAHELCHCADYGKQKPTTEPAADACAAGVIATLAGRGIDCRPPPPSPPQGVD